MTEMCLIEESQLTRKMRQGTIVRGQSLHGAGHPEASYIVADGLALVRLE
jgi:hypothetical protein